MSIHAYRETRTGWRFLPQANTISRAKKSKDSVPSVTTVLSIIPEPEVKTDEGFYRKSEVELYLSDPKSVTFEKAKEALYGYRTCPVSGKDIKSSDFGTRAHLAMELWAKGVDISSNPYYEVTSAARKAVKEMLDDDSEMEAEIIVGSSGVSAGTVDLVGKSGGKYILIDYKFRQCNRGVGKFYDKDLAQLSIEARWYSYSRGLDYLPAIRSICVCCDTGNAYVRKWRESSQARGEEIFEGCRALFRSLNRY